jgi:hypothetical protein
MNSVRLQANTAASMKLSSGMSRRVVTLKMMKAVRTSETSVNFVTRRRYIPADSKLHNVRTNVHTKQLRVSEMWDRILAAGSYKTEGCVDS